MVLDDLHWADAIAIWVLDHLPRALGDAPVALVATSRDREPDMPQLDGVRRASRLIPLNGLDVDGVRELAARGDHRLRSTPSRCTPGPAGTHCSCRSSFAPPTAAG